MGSGAAGPGLLARDLNTVADGAQLTVRVSSGQQRLDRDAHHGAAGKGRQEGLATARACRPAGAGRASFDVSPGPGADAPGYEL